MRKYTLVLSLFFALILTCSCIDNPNPEPFPMTKIAVLQQSIKDYDDLKKDIDISISQANILDKVTTFFPSELHKTYKYDNPPEEIKSVLVRLESANKYIEEARAFAKSESVEYEKTKTIRPEIIQDITNNINKACEETNKAKALLLEYKATN